MSNQTQREKAEIFARLHIKGEPLILFNIWDAGSAQAIQSTGVRAIATGSWSVAASQGYADGEQVPLQIVLANLERIVASVDLPVTLDFEGGYGHSPAEVQHSALQVIASGAVGINFEDGVIGGTGLYSIQDQCARIAAIREAAERESIPFFINARTDIFLKEASGVYSDEQIRGAMDRAIAYNEAGASGFFAPGLRDSQQIKSVCERSPLPVNVMVMPGIPATRELAGLGVARISHGPGPYRRMIAFLKEAASQALSME